MTKNVRVENADGSNYKVQVLVYDMKVPGVIDPLNDFLVKTISLDYPSNMTGTMGLDSGIHDSRYLVVRENGVRTS